jgi:hypothetical protein
LPGLVVVTDEELNGTDIVGELLGKGLCVAMDQKLTLSNLLSRMPLICGESFNSVAKTLQLLFVPKARGVGVFGSLIRARVLERI